MAVEIYLGNPPTNIKQWIIDHTMPTGHPETIFTFQDGTTKPENITGTLDQQWMSANGYWNEDDWWLKLITQADIGNTVTSIGNYAFDSCSSLMSVTIPNSVTSIGNYAFNECNSLTSITIPNSVTSIGACALAYCNSLTSITIPNSVTSIGDSAFECSYSLTSMTIPDSVTSIGTGTFSGCRDLTMLTMQGKTVSQVQAMNYSNWYLESGCIIHCTDDDIEIQ